MNILGVPVYLNTLSVACLLPTLLCFTSGIYILTLNRKTFNTWMFFLMTVFVGLFDFGYAIASSTFDPLGAYHRWLTVFTVLPMLGFLFLFFMTYSESMNIRFYLQIFSFIIVTALLVSIFFAVRSLSAPRIFRLSGQFWDFEMNPESLLVGFFILLFGLGTLYFSLVKFKQMKNRHSARTFLTLVVIMNIYLLPSATLNPLARKGVITFDFFLWIQAVGTTVGFLLVYIIFLSHTQERTTVAGNMIGTTLVVVVTCIPILAYPLIEDRKASFREIWSAKLAAGYQPAADSSIVFLNPAGTSPSASDAPLRRYFRDNPDYYQKALSSVPADGVILRADAKGGVYTFPVSLAEPPRTNQTQPTSWTVGIELVELRKYIHPTAAKLVLAQLVVILVIVSLFPLFFRGILLNPMRRLLDGVIAVSRGRYHHRIENARSDELGVISRHFDKMAETIESATTRLEDTVRDRTAQLTQEKKKSDTLLLNILPKQIADELKEKGRATPVRINSATVLFTDFVGFTKISETLTPEQVVDELDKCFSYFDQVTEKYRLEKLKTIGDSFMCAGGLPTMNRTHAIDCCLAALEIQSFMQQMKEIKHQQGFEYWELRLGIHSGPLVAGVVGHKKFAYDVWGDTVNTASRLESSGVPGKINISVSTYQLVKDLFACEHRGQVSAKNKGEIDMYFLNSIQPNFSLGGEGRVPNETFRQHYKNIMRMRET